MLWKIRYIFVDQFLERTILIGLIIALPFFFTEAVRGDEADTVAAYGREAVLPGPFSIRVGVIETSHIGAYDRYAAPVVNDWINSLFSGGGGGGGELGESGDVLGERTLRQTLLPDGLPHDFYWAYHFRPGLKASLDYESDMLKWWNGGSTRFSAFVMMDQTHLTLHAPSGIGILLDPTNAALHAEFYGGGLKAMFPLVSKKWSKSSLDLHLGGGMFAFHSKTTLEIKSDFLDIHIKETRNRIKPLVSLELTMQWDNLLPDLTVGTRPIQSGLSFGIDSFQTDYLWTVSGSASYRIKF